MSPNQLLAAGILLAFVFILPATAESPYGCNESSLNGTSWITIYPVGTYNEGDNINITSITNLEEGQDIDVTVWGTSWCSMRDSCRCPSLGGTSGTVTVVKGNCGLNQTSFMVNTSSFTPGEFLVTEQAVSETANDSVLLNLLASPTYNASMAYDECVAARSQPSVIPTITSQISATVSNTLSDNVTASASAAAAFNGTPLSGSAPPLAVFGYGYGLKTHPETASVTVDFMDASKNSPTSWLWSFGDGDTSTLQYPQHTYSSGGTYTVFLTVANAAGSNTTWNSVVIPGVTVIIPPATQGTPSAMSTPNAGQDEISILGALAVCGVIFLFRKKGN